MLGIIFIYKQNPSQSPFAKGEMTIMLSFLQHFEKKYYCVYPNYSFI